MNCVSCDICVYHLGLCVFFPGVFLSSRVTGACPVTTDVIMRVNVRTTTTIFVGRVSMRWRNTFFEGIPRETANSAIVTSVPRTTEALGL